MQKNASGSEKRRAGFRRTSALVEQKLRNAGESRGFAITRLLTHWSEIVGAPIAEICTPVKVSYAQKGFGATLVVLTTGPQAEVLAMQVPQLREKVNACYGYNAISRIRITQTAPIGFSDGKARFGALPKDCAPSALPRHRSKSQGHCLRDQRRRPKSSFGSLR
jgi:hypothetical protein